MGKDSNPLTEVELLAESLMNNAGVFRPGKVVKWVPERSVTKIGSGDPIQLDLPQLEALADAFLAEIETRFVTSSSSR